ncbi:hypothetical protein KC332_g6932 [Hortaea werneckii]|nr:hypothetical protein KC358_g16029 [Hortaea werneckii]KAI6801010.1 hypothetical protein KC350_g15755 [Hortaea werneckii]KAI6902621.1 hypothetical protein KC348_g16013 [Hortaea werneckii]KAI6921602.1 hypothetical protein KC341_g15832 [Hortaea werneckii]KAI6955081.1 hypothetical protein KC321_g15974 [Hortaea werneckii]
MAQAAKLLDVLRTPPAGGNFTDDYLHDVVQLFQTGEFSKLRSQERAELVVELSRGYTASWRSARKFGQQYKMRAAIKNLVTVHNAIGPSDKRVYYVPGGLLSDLTLEFVDADPEVEEKRKGKAMDDLTAKLKTWLKKDNAMWAREAQKTRAANFVELCDFYTELWRDTVTRKEAIGFRKFLEPLLEKHNAAADHHYKLAKLDLVAGKFLVDYVAEPSERERFEADNPGAAGGAPLETIGETTGSAEGSGAQQEPVAVPEDVGQTGAHVAAVDSGDEDTDDPNQSGEESPKTAKAPRPKVQTNSRAKTAGVTKPRNRSKAFRLQNGWTDKARDEPPQVNDEAAIKILLDSKTLTRQRNAKAPNYFTMRGLLYEDKRHILTARDANGKLRIPEKTAKSALDTSKTSYNNLLSEDRMVLMNQKDVVRSRKQSHFKQKHDGSGKFGGTDKIPESLTTMGKAELLDLQLKTGKYDTSKKASQRTGAQRLNYEKEQEKTAAMRSKMVKDNEKLRRDFLRDAKGSDDDDDDDGEEMEARRAKLQAKKAAAEAEVARIQKKLDELDKAGAGAPASKKRSPTKTPRKEAGDGKGKNAGAEDEDLILA